MLKDNHRQLSALLMSFDVILSAMVFVALLMVPSVSGIADPASDVSSSMVALSIAALLAWPVAFQHLDLYASMRTQDVSQVLFRVILASVATSMFLAAAAFAFSVPVKASFPFVVGGVQLCVLGISRILLVLPLRAIRRYGRNFRNVLIVGTGPRAAYVKRSIDSKPGWGLRVIGFVDDADTPVDPSLFNAKLFKLDAMPDLLREQVVDRVIIAYPRSMLSQLSPVVSVCASAGIPFTMLADLFGDFLPPPKVTQFGSLAALVFAPVHHSPVLLAVKRCIDIVGAAAALVLTSPVIAASALAIRLNDGGPVLFRQIRCGQNGRTFTMFKLRTMCIDADEQKVELAHLNECDGPIFKCRNDPRITRVGRTLRKLSLDELPQLWNVLRGDMSLVGPRPPVPEEVDQYQTFERRRLSMRPGITCIWQVSGRSNIGFDQWVRLDVEYIDSWSLGLDLRILLKTIPAVLRGDGAR
jgi:exopolysaccharide biosynthesis polyprenyl glycosylphosphotransferase